jgi:hypothetical protein
MSPAQVRLAFKKQRAINRRLQQQIRAQAMLCNALASVRFDKRRQKPAVLQRIRNAHALLESVIAGNEAPAKPYPVKSAA